MTIEKTTIFSTCDESDQNIRFFRAPGKARPLLVALHTWSFDYSQDVAEEYIRRCEARGWHCIFPDFRGANRNPGACGSDAALSDIQDAVNWAMGAFSFDHRRIFLAGESGGGHMALLAAGRMPSLWTAVSAWVPIFDLARWHGECVSRELEYAAEMEAVCGGAPGSDPSVDREYLVRSPLDSFWRAHIVPVDINAGIHDGHGGTLGGQGSVPVGHSIRAFNALVKASGKERNIIPEAIIEHIERSESVPGDFAGQGVSDPTYGREIHLRRLSSLARLTLFEGGHEILYDAAFSWFEGF